MLMAEAMLSIRDGMKKADLKKALACAGCVSEHKVYMAIGQNLVPLVNIKIAGKWMFIPLELIIIGFDPPQYRIII